MQHITSSGMRGVSADQDAMQSVDAFYYIVLKYNKLQAFQGWT